MALKPKDPANVETRWIEKPAKAKLKTANKSKLITKSQKTVAASNKSNLRSEGSKTRMHAYELSPQLQVLKQRETKRQHHTLNPTNVNTKK